MDGCLRSSISRCRSGRSVSETGSRSSSEGATAETGRSTGCSAARSRASADASSRRRTNVAIVTADAVVADLSAGFWVSLFSTSYEVPFVWRRNLPAILPFASEHDVRKMHAGSERLLVLRNRIAHHEPIFQLDLEALHSELHAQLRAMCPATHAYALQSSTLSPLWKPGAT